MAWFGSKKNGEHITHNKPKPSELGHVHRPVIVDHSRVKQPILGHDLSPSDHIHRPVIIDHNGLKHGGYAESHNSEQYMVQTEEVVKFRRFSGMEDQIYRPIRKEAYGTGDWSEKDDQFSPKVHDERIRAPIEDSSWNNNNSPPSKDHHHHHTRGKYGNLNSDSNYTDDEDDDDDDVRVKSTRGTRTINNIKEQEYHNDKKNQRNGLSIVPTPNHLKDQEDYYENENPKTNGYKPHTFTAPIPNHETSNFKPMANSPPQFNARPGNYKQEIIDSTEARRRYGKSSPGDGAGIYREEKYSGGTIDSKEAARKYNGVFLAN